MYRDLSKHPFQKFLDQRIRIALSTDNRAISRVSVTDEYERAVKLFDIDENALAATDTISSGTTILFEIALDECDQPAGGAVELRIIINGGGETYAQMEISEVELGAVLV